MIDINILLYMQVSSYHFYILQYLFCCENDNIIRQII